MQHSPSATFTSKRETGKPGMKEAIAIARRSVTGLTDQKIDGVSLCQKTEDGSWTVVLDVVDSPARMGENDLLAAFEVRVDMAGEVNYCSRQRRYRREDRDAS